MKKFKDFLYDKNDILIALLILIGSLTVRKGRNRWEC